MKFFAISITNNATTYGGVKILCQVVLFVFVPDRCTTYDSVGRLTSETIDGTTKTYTYDSQNNVQKAGLTYTNGKLMSVNGAQIVYDEMGNPTTYKGNTFVWQQARKLVGGTLNGNAQNIDGTPHDGLTGVPDKGVRDAIEKATKGKWTWNVNKMVLGDLPRWQEGFSVSSLPYHQESFSVEQLPQYQEQFSTGGLSPWQEGFSMPSIEKNNVLIYVLGGAAVVVVFGAAVYFTGGYALILLA